jgi:hypothetical protein
MVVEVNVASGRASAHEIFDAVRLVMVPIYEQLSEAVITGYEKHIVGLLCQSARHPAKTGLALHEVKGQLGRGCRCRRFRRAGFWAHERRLRGPQGDVSFRPSMIECEACGRRLTPILEALELQPYQSRMEQLLLKVVEAVAETSYRRGSEQVSVLAEVPVAKSTAHRWAASVEMPLGSTGSDDVLAGDGTGFKKSGGIKGQVRLVLKIGPENKIQPVGVWAGKEWKQIAEEVKDQQTGQARLFLSDGERGLEDWLGRLCQKSQRCHWHAAREVGYALWEDKVSSPDRQRLRKHVGHVISLEIPEEDLEFVSPNEKASILERIRVAEEQIDGLRSAFEAKGYEKAATYLRRARDQLFNHLRLWLDTGIIAPRTTSIVENLIRELVRRLKKIGWNWSDEGAARLGRIVMIRRYDPEGWMKFWNERLNLRGRCNMVLTSCEAQLAA